MVRFMRCDNKWFFILLYNFLYFPNFKQSAWIIFIREKKPLIFLFSALTDHKERLYCRKDHRGEGRGASRGGARGLTQSAGSQSWTSLCSSWLPTPDTDSPNQSHFWWEQDRWGCSWDRWWEAWVRCEEDCAAGACLVPTSCFCKLLWGLKGRKEGLWAF